MHGSNPKSHLYKPALRKQLKNQGDFNMIVVLDTMKFYENLLTEKHQVYFKKAICLQDHDFD